MLLEKSSNKQTRGRKKVIDCCLVNGVAGVKLDVDEEVLVVVSTEGVVAFAVTAVDAVVDVVYNESIN